MYTNYCCPPCGSPSYSQPKPQPIEFIHLGPECMTDETCVHVHVAPDGLKIVDFWWGGSIMLSLTGDDWPDFTKWYAGDGDSFYKAGVPNIYGTGHYPIERMYLKVPSLADIGDPVFDYCVNGSTKIEDVVTIRCANHLWQQKGVDRAYVCTVHEDKFYECDTIDAEILLIPDVQTLYGMTQIAAKIAAYPGFVFVRGFEYAVLDNRDTPIETRQLFPVKRLNVPLP